MQPDRFISDAAEDGICSGSTLFGYRYFNVKSNNSESIFLDHGL